MTIGDTTELDIIKFVFLNSTTSLNVPTWANQANFWFALHYTLPADSDTATYTEPAYTGYARPSIVRTTLGFTSANPTANVAAVNTGAMTGGTGGTAAAGSIVTTTSGAGQIIAWGSITPSIVISTGVTPSFAAGAITFALD